MAIDVGDLYRLTYDHKSPGGDLVNADSMTVTIELPDTTTTEPVTVTPGSTGKYVYDYQTSQPGRHLARWVGTGTNPGAYAEAFDSRPADPAYLISPADARQALSSTDAGAAAMTAHDDELRVYIEGATGAVEKYLNEVLLRRTIVEHHQLWRRSVPSLTLRQGPAISLSSVVSVDGFRSWDIGGSGGLDLDPETGVVSVTYGPWIFGHVLVTYVAGYQVVPANYVLAVRITLQHLWSTQRGSRGAPRVGGMADTLAIPGMGFGLPNAAIELLGAPTPGIA